MKGVSVTGQSNVSHHFEMHTENLCPPGPFSVSFQLPGPVDPRGFRATFDNGILEAVVLKDVQDHVKVSLFLFSIDYNRLLELCI